MVKKRKAPASNGGLDRRQGRVRATRDWESARDKTGQELFEDKIYLEQENGAADDEDGFDEDLEEVLPLKLATEQGEDSSQEDIAPTAKKAKRNKSKHDAVDTHKAGRFAKSVTEHMASSSSQESEEDSVKEHAQETAPESWGQQYHVSRREMSNAAASKGKNKKRGKVEEDGVDELREALTIQAAQKSLLRPEDFSTTFSDVSDSDEDGSVEPEEQAILSFPSRDAAIVHLLSTRPYLLPLLTDYATLAHMYPALQDRLQMAITSPSLSVASKGISSLQVDLVQAYLTVSAFYLSLISKNHNAALADQVLHRLTVIREQIQNMEDAGIPLDRNEAEEGNQVNGSNFHPDSDDQDEETEGLSSSEDDSDFDAESLLSQDDVDVDQMSEKDRLKLLVEQQAELLKSLQDKESNKGMFAVENKHHSNQGLLEQEASASAEEKRRKKGKPRMTSAEKKQLAALKAQTALAAANKIRRPIPSSDYSNDFIEASQLSRLDADDKAKKKHSLRFHTSQISAKESKRQKATLNRIAGGDDDVPFISKEARRREAQRREAARVSKALAAQVDPSKASDQDQASRDGDASLQDDGYYDLVKSSKASQKAAKKQDYDDKILLDRQVLTHAEDTDGPRSVSYAILANKGLTPKRNKLNRNPRVKKRHKYEKAKIKIGSQKSVYKSDAALKGRQSYSGEKSGIGKKVVKSRKLSS